MSTTVGTSLWVSMLGHYLFTPLFEHARDRRPPVAALDEAASRVSERTAPRRVAQKRDDGIGEGARIVGRQVMTAWPDAESFRADRRGDDRPGHCQRFENL